MLDLNADTGRLAFELAPFFDDITAIDFSARFIRMPIQLQEKGFMRYIIKDENDLVLYRELVLAETGLGVGKENILFMQDNANNLKSIYTGYDLIIAPNLLEELANPVVFLQQIHAPTSDFELRCFFSKSWYLGLIKASYCSKKVAGKSYWLTSLIWF